MNDKLYSVRTWVDAPTDKRTNIFIDYAKAIGVKDIDKFKADMGDTFIAKKIRFDIAIADKDGVSGTPAFFLNGKQVEDKVSGSVINGDGSEMEKALDELLK
jgi:protein-disulfide isomerase